MDKALCNWMVETRDTSLIPEAMWYDFIGSDRPFKTIYDYAQSDEFAVTKVLEAAKLASRGEAALLPETLMMLSDTNPLLRHWAAFGIFQVHQSTPEIQKALRQVIADDAYSANRTMAAQALARCGDPDTAFTALMKEINTEKDEFKRLLALNALEYGRVVDRLTQEDREALSKHKPYKPAPHQDHLAYHWAKGITDHLLETVLNRSVLK